MTPPRDSKNAHVARALALSILSVLLVATIWVVPYLPTNDGPESILAVHIENHFGDPGVIYPEVFVPAPQFAGRGFTVLFEPLEDLLGWRRGTQVALSIIVLTQAWGAVALLAALDVRRISFAFVAFPLALSWPLYMGFFAFCLASGVGLFILAAALRGNGLLRSAVTAALLLLQAFFHMFAAVLTGTVLAVAIVARAPRGRRLAALLEAAITGLPALGLTVAAFLVARHAATAVPFGQGFSHLPLHESAALLPRTLLPGPLARAGAVTMLVVTGLGLAARRALARETPAVERVLPLAAAALLAIGVLGPLHVPGWQFFSQRFVWLGAVLAIVAVPLPSGRAAAPVGWLLFGGSALSLVLSCSFHGRLAAAASDVVAGLDAPVARRRVFLPITLEPAGKPGVSPTDAEVPFLAPLRHIGALFAVAEGGLTPFTFASNPVTWPFTLRPDAPAPPPVPPLEEYIGLLSRPDFQTDLEFRRLEEGILATYAMLYEGIVLTGARADDLAFFHRRGFVTDWERGTVLIGHFEPCALHISVPAGTPPRVDVGVGETTLVHDVSLRPHPSANGRVRLTVDRGPCGEAWARPHWSREGRSVYCEGANATGEVPVSISREGGRVVCDPASP